jgi:hypothetical protein
MPRLHRILEKAGVGYHSFVNISELSHVGIRKLLYRNAYDLVIALGVSVWNTIETKHKPGGSYCIPHPSPLNRQWNDKAYEDLVASKLKDRLCVIPRSN